MTDRRRDPVKLRLPLWVRIPLSVPFFAIGSIWLTGTMERHAGDPPFWSLAGSVVLTVSFLLVGLQLLGAPPGRIPAGRRLLRAAIAVGILIICVFVVETVHSRSVDPSRSLALLASISISGALAIHATLTLTKQTLESLSFQVEEVRPHRGPAPGVISPGDPHSPTPLLEPPEDPTRPVATSKRLSELGPRELEMAIQREVYSPRTGWESRTRWMRLSWYLRLPIGGVIFALGPVAFRLVRLHFPHERPGWVMAIAIVVFIVTMLAAYQSIRYPPEAYYTGSRWWRWPAAIALFALLVFVGPKISAALESSHPVLETFVLAFTIFVTAAPIGMVFLDSPMGRAKTYWARRRALDRLIREENLESIRRCNEAREHQRALEQGGSTPDERIRQLERFLEAYLPRRDLSQESRGERPPRGSDSGPAEGPRARRRPERRG